MQRLGLRSGVGDIDLHQQVRGTGLGVEHIDHPIAVVIEHSGVEELVLGHSTTTGPVHRQEILIGIGSLRVVIAPMVPGVTRHCVEVPPVLLGVLAVVSLGAVEAEESLLQNRVPTVPEREAEAEALLNVTEAGQSVLTPAVGPRPRMVVREVVPGVTIGAVVLADRGPLAFTDVGTPPVPVTRRAQTVLEGAEGCDAFSLCAHGRFIVGTRRRLEEGTRQYRCRIAGPTAGRRASRRRSGGVARRSSRPGTPPHRRRMHRDAGREIHAPNRDRS